MVTSASGYGANHAAASRTDPAMVGWTPASGSADAMLLDELGEIRDRSQDLGRNSGYVAGANRAFQDNIIGHQLRVNPGPVASLLGWSADAADDWARTTRAQAESWFNVPAEFDAAMGLGIRGMSNQALAGWFLDGEALALPVVLGEQCPCGAVELDDLSHGLFPFPDNCEIKYGIQGCWEGRDMHTT
jgi:capsid protein